MYSRRRGMTTGPPEKGNQRQARRLGDGWDRKADWGRENKRDKKERARGRRKGGNLVDLPPKMIVPAKYSDEKSSNVRCSCLSTICIVTKRMKVKLNATRITAPSCHDIAGISEATFSSLCNGSFVLDGTL